MSGLEPIAALSLACNILQVAGIGREAVRLVRQVYQDGTIDPALKENACTLEELSAQILPSTTATSSSTNSVPQDKQLVSLADTCQRAAHDLQEEVNFLNGPPTKAKLVATLKIAAKTTWRKRRLDRLDQRLKEAESTLQTGLLTRVYERSVKVDSGLLALDASVRAFIDEYRKGHTDATSLTRKHITMESKRSEDAVKLHVTQETSQAKDSLKEHIGLAFRGVAKQGQDAQLDAKRHRLLQSLKFNRMNERRNLVSSSHPHTFTWMLRDGSERDGTQSTEESSENEFYYNQYEYDLKFSHATHSWDSFSDWLRSTDTVYWISGKPGSGKTTLIKYLLGQPRLQEYLDQWRPDTRVISHFFWRPGTSMQQSIRGLLCSLLYQLLLEDDEIVNHVLTKYDLNSTKDTETDWSGEELQNALHDVVSHYPRPIAIFLDGLDEVLPKDGVLRLLGVVDELKELYGPDGKVKLCLGSRREPVLCKRLGGHPQLRLEQLNRIDLQQYGNDNINIPTDYHITMSTTYTWGYFSQERLPSRTELRQWLVDSLVYKAEGVFLWMCLTVTTVTKALNENETVEDLEHRIESLPGELADLYADMWTRMNHSNHFKICAASYLQLALAGLGDNFNFHLSPFIMMAASTAGMADHLLQSGPFNHAQVESLIEACEKTRREVLSRCAGLLTCPNIKEAKVKVFKGMSPWHAGNYSSLIPYVSEFPTYSFLHRTARDFLTDTEAGQTILSWGSFPGYRAEIQLLIGHLAIRRLFKRPLYTGGRSNVRITNGDNMVRWFVIRMFSLIPRQTLQLENSEYDGSARMKISSLLLICEQLFNDGYLCGTPTTPANSMRFEQHVMISGEYAYHDITVNRRYEFLIEAASYFCYAPDAWNYLIPIIESRNVDSNTLSQLLIHACSFSGSNKFPLEGLDARLKAIKALLGCGASPDCETLRRNKADSDFAIPLIVTYETPFRTLMMSVWDIAANYSIENSHSEKLLSLIGLFIAHGADLREEVHIVVEVEGGLIEFRDLWRDLNEYPLVKPSSLSPSEAVHSPKGSMHVVLIVACPAFVIIANILKIWQLETLPQIQWLTDSREMIKSDIGLGHTIAVVDFSKMEILISTRFSRTLFLGDMFPLHSGNILEDGLQELVRLAGSGLHDAVLNNDNPSKGDRGVLSHVLVPLEVQERAARALGQLKSTDVPAMERRREVRMRLGVCTPLEEEEWQNNDLDIERRKEDSPNSPINCLAGSSGTD